jgi:hypothetical protein
MNRRHWIIWAMAAYCAFATASVRAEGWSLFSKDEPEEARPSWKLSDDEDQGPNMWERMNSGAKSMWDRARRSMNWGSSKPKQRVATARPVAKKKSGFGLSNLFRSDEPEEPATLAEWIGQPRPE